jgi:alkylresorcinol/alkylpyrone synthase
LKTIVTDEFGSSSRIEALRCSNAVILSIGTALPANVIPQSVAVSRLRELWKEQYDSSREWRWLFEQIFRSVRVDQRYLALPLSEYPALDSFSRTNNAWLRVAPELATGAIQQALTRAQLAADSIDHLFFITGTGIATPSVDALIVNRLGMRPDVRRTPIFGLGCAGGVAGIARAAELLRSTDEVALVVSVELCSLTLQRDDSSIPNVIGAALFGDGAAAVILAGANSVGERRFPRIIATRSVFYPSTERLMGWDVVDTGLRIVLSPAIPDIVREHLGNDVDGFLSTQGLERSAITHWIAHTGGNRVLEAIATGLSLPAAALERSWRLLASTGNLSSASALFVLNDLIEEGAAKPGDYGMLLAMGPGFCAELALLRW